MTRKKKCCFGDWGVKPEDVRDEAAAKKFDGMYRKAKSTMDQRTRMHKFFAKVSHMQNLHDRAEESFSDGTTQAIKRKLRSEAIQRVPDGTIHTQYDKNSLEQVQVEFIFKHKVMTSELDGHDMLKNLWRAFNAAYDYGFACVKTGFENDADGDIRVTWKQLGYRDVYPAPDCDYIEQAEWYIVKEHYSRSFLKTLLDEDGEVLDPTWNRDVVRLLLQDKYVEGADPVEMPLADVKNGAMKHESVEAWTLYKRGSDTFETYVPCVQGIIRIVENYDPRKDVPLHFLVLEPDPEFPLGCSCVMWTLAQQQWLDAFQTTSYQAMLLAANPPLQVYGNLTTQTLRMRPYAIWNMGTNQNNRVEPFRVETTTLNQFGNIKKTAQADMLKNMNATESTVATDAQTMNYSGTPQGVEQQRRDKSVTVNTYQKRIEVFFSEWANHATRSYIASMGGVQKLTVDESTRRKVWSFEKAHAPAGPDGEPMVEETIIDGDKIEIDFDLLSADMFEFQVRSGSLVQGEREHELQSLQQLVVPVSQMMGNISEENRGAFEDVLMKAVKRICELSDIDISAEVTNDVERKIVLDGMRTIIEEVQQQQQQINALMQLMSPQAPAQSPQNPAEAALPNQMAPMPAEETMGLEEPL